MSGTFIIKKTPKGYYRFSLKAVNGTILLTSQNYTTMQNCKKGIESIIRNSEVPIEDTTLKKAADPLTYPKFEIYLDTEGKVRYRLMAENGKNIAIAEDGYASKEGCLKGIASIAANCISPQVLVEE